jgi:hypothetical protein
MAQNITVTETTNTIEVTEPDALRVVTEMETQVVQIAPVLLSVETTIENAVVRIPASAAMSALRVIASGASGTAVYADPTTAQTRDTIIGISTTSVGLGVPIDIQVSGELTDGGWSWTPGGKLFAGTNGALTQTAPTTGYVRCVGHAATATKIVIDIGEAVALA